MGQETDELLRALDLEVRVRDRRFVVVREVLVELSVLLVGDLADAGPSHQLLGPLHQLDSLLVQLAALAANRAHQIVLGAVRNDRDEVDADRLVHGGVVEEDLIVAVGADRRPDRPFVLELAAAPAEDDQGRPSALGVSMARPFAPTSPTVRADKKDTRARRRS